MARISNKARAEKFAQENGIELTAIDGIEVEFCSDKAHLSFDRRHTGVFEVGEWSDYPTMASAYADALSEMQYLKPCNSDCDCWN